MEEGNRTDSAGHSSVIFVLDTYGDLFGGEDQELADRFDVGLLL